MTERGGFAYGGDVRTESDLGCRTLTVESESFPRNAVVPEIIFITNSLCGTAPPRAQKQPPIGSRRQTYHVTAYWDDFSAAA